MVSTHDIIRTLCKAIKRTGLGDYWYENPKETLLYKVYQVLLFISFYLMTLSEFLEVILNSLPRDLHADALALSLAYAIVLVRFHAYIYKKKDIRELNKEVIGYAEDEEKDAVDVKRRFRRIQLSIGVLTLVVYSGVFFYLIEGLRRYFDNHPFIILAAYWPRYEDDSPLGISFKILIYLTCGWMLASMISVDMLVVSHLIILYYRFIFLRRYFGRLEADFRSSDVTTMELKEKCLEGLMKHRELIRFSKKILNCFGVMMSLQVLQGSSIVVLLLLRTLLAAHLTLPALMMNFFFGLALLIQLAFYMWNAGEVTYQASLISSAIFYCGWHMRSPKEEGGRDIRRLILMGCAQAQRPVLMKAFGVQDLSYQAFVSVVRATYSIFAVLY